MLSIALLLLLTDMSRFNLSCSQVIGLEYCARDTEKPPKKQGRQQKIVIRAQAFREITIFSPLP